MLSGLKLQPCRFGRLFKGGIVQAQRAHRLNHNGRRRFGAVLFTEPASVAAFFMNNRHRGSMSFLLDDIHRAVRAVFLAHHAAPVFRPGEAGFPVNDGGACFGPFLFFQRQGVYGLRRTNGPAGRAVRSARAGTRVKKWCEYPGKTGLKPDRLQASCRTGFHAFATAQTAV